MRDFASQCHLLSFAQSTIVKEPIYAGHGWPKKDAKPTGYHYFIDATPHTDLEKVKLANLKVGMFILATGALQVTAKGRAWISLLKKPRVPDIINFSEEASANRGTTNDHDT